MRWLITTHAVERLMGRADRELSPQQAHVLLTEALSRGERQSETTNSGEERWLVRVGKTSVIVIAKKDPTIRCRVAVSLLRLDEPPETDLEDPTEEVLLAYQRQLATMGALPVPVELVPERRPTGALYNRIGELEAALARAQGALARQAEEKALAEAEKRYHESDKAADRLKRLEASHRSAVAEVGKLKSRIRDLEMSSEVSAEGKDRLQRLKDHAISETEQKDLFQGCLRIAVRYLRQHEVTSVLHAIAERDAYLTTDAFAEPWRFTAEERREAARLARVEHEQETAA